MDSKQADGFNETVSSIVERKVRVWFRGVLDDMRRSSPVQQWLDSIPVEAESSTSTEVPDIKHLEIESDESKADETLTANTVIENVEEKCSQETIQVPQNDCSKISLEGSPKLKKPKNKLQRDNSIQSEGFAPRIKNPLLRDYSLQSDASGSSGSSVLNVLGARKVDAESVLLALGFGPSEKQQKLQRIPDRFLVPSKLKGISTEQFIKDEHHSIRMHDCGVYGYRGLTGNPHVPPSTIVAKIMECILQEDVCREEALTKARHSIADMRSPLTVQAYLASRLRHSKS